MHGGNVVVLAISLGYQPTADPQLAAADMAMPSLTANLIVAVQVAILAGDFLLARASVSLAALRNSDVMQLFSQVIEDLVSGEIMQVWPLCLQSKERDPNSLRSWQILLSPAVGMRPALLHLGVVAITSAGTNVYSIVHAVADVISAVPAAAGLIHEPGCWRDNAGEFPFAIR